VPTIRCDLIDVYVFRRDPVEFLQLLRAEPPLAGTWHPVMGHAEGTETAVACALRELAQELALLPANILGLWALQEVHPFYLATSDAVMLSPRFAVEVPRGWAPQLNHEHLSSRWVKGEETQTAFLWPGQRTAAAEVLETIIPGTPGAAFCRINPTGF
jgi:8-oxo-dGTP pyrophosphatase MutT (NUDIX family)